MPVQVACEHCGTTFDTRPARIKSGRGKYCSQACYWESKQKEEIDAWQLVDQSRGPNACWEWQGTITSYGYGQIKVQGGLWRAHRLIYTLAHGPIPDSLMVRHRCDNRRCCNPAHLELGTHDDNMQDMNERGRRSRGPRPNAHHILRGSEHHQAKLTESSVKAIRQALASGETGKSIAARYGVGETTITQIKHERIWRHVK